MSLLSPRISLSKISLFLILPLIFIIPKPALTENSKVLFSPNGGCQEAIVLEISKAKKTIDVAMYYLTTREIAQELVKAKEKGVAIRIFLDQSQEHASYSKSRYLMKRGIEVRFYVGSGLMHNKFAIIDNKTLITGSFNWTATADRENQENLLIMTDKDLIKQYSDRFELLWKSGRKSELKLEEGGEE